MKLGFDFDLAEKCERSHHYPIPGFEDSEKAMLKMEVSAGIKKPMPNAEPHAQNPMPKAETHAQKPMLKSYTTEEQIETEFDAILNLIRVANMCENHAFMARNLNDPIAEDRFITEASHALEAAHELFILTHK